MCRVTRLLQMFLQIRHGDVWEQVKLPVAWLLSQKEMGGLINIVEMIIKGQCESTVSSVL